MKVNIENTYSNTILCVLINYMWFLKFLICATELSIPQKLLKIQSFLLSIKIIQAIENNRYKDYNDKWLKFTEIYIKSYIF